MKSIVPPFVLAALVIVILMAGIPAPSANAFDPPWPAGIPWPTTVPWPTANPLKIGVPWSPPYQSFPVYVASPAPAPVVVAPAALPPVVVSSGVPVPSPLPPVIVSTNSSVSLPPVVPSVNNSLPANDASYSSAGSTRDSAFTSDGTTRVLGAGASAWYKIGASGEHIDVRLNATPLGGVSMSIYAPNGSDQPIGRGTPDNIDSTGLIWSGGHWNGDGIWYALVTNSNPISVQVRVTSTTQDISNKTCHSYYENLANGLTHVLWTVCE